MDLTELSAILRRLFVFKRTFTLAEIRTLVALPSPGAGSPQRKGSKARERVSIRELAAELKFNGPSMSRTVSLLVDDGLASRVEDPDDRRLVLLARTAVGEQLLRKVIRKQ